MLHTEPKPLVITGVASGIGADTCRRLAAAGHVLVGVDRTPVSDFPGQFIVGDLASAAGIEAVVSQLPQSLGGLVNIAGVPGTAPMDVVLAVNVFAVRDLTAACLPRIEEGGCVVNLSSSVADDWRTHSAAVRELAFCPREDQQRAQQLAGDASYLWSKRAVRLLTEYFAAQQVGRRIRVTSVSPGPVQTPILDDFRQDHGQDKVNGAGELLGRFGNPEDISAVVEFLVGEQGRWVNGTDIRVDGGLGAWRGEQAAGQLQGRS
ncbi:MULTISPECIES: SDR family oxidoreductase [unclassified Luteococcus]|uniref:SDR family oxidoreductase n=1 Tax=unclassified Luteococcus TaxID=2639923 RepID=UPI00313CB370